MTDIVTRLRRAVGLSIGPGLIFADAADEIERLQADQLGHDQCHHELLEAEAEVKRLRHQVASFSADFLKVYGAYTAEREENERLRGLLREARYAHTRPASEWKALSASIDAALGDKHD